MRLRLLASSLSGLALLVGCAGHVQVGQSPDPSEFHPAWQRLPDPPLAPRSGPVVAWTGTDVLVVGGDTGAPCPPTADCKDPLQGARDGARYSVAARTWRPIASAPVAVPAYSGHALVGRSLYVLAGDSLLAYDVASDTWARIPTPARFRPGQLVADAGRLVVASDSDEHGVTPDRVYDPSTRDWSALPDDPIGPSFDRTLTAIPTGLVLTAHQLVPNPGADGPSVLLASRFDRDAGIWTRLPDSDQLGGDGWTWTGRRLVDPSLGGADGGEVGNYGRTVPYGGALDPATGRWSRLRHAPKVGTGGWPVAALGGRFAATGGWTYDDDTRSWAPVPKPGGGPQQPGAAVWAGDRLLVVGGVYDDRGYTTDALSKHAWISRAGETLGRPLQ